ncbi:alpha/beta hydrolase [Aquipseudomonas alcaligenes]|uniref:alpha/beta hydrolase n=1 Tax=Aquipseudomonas alcaligenes TaxID=43263 RepID=UPI003748B4A2
MTTLPNGCLSAWCWSIAHRVARAIAGNRSIHGGLALLALLPALAMGKPDLTQKVGPTLADSGSSYYRFERYELGSADGLRHYRVVLGIPKRPAPAAGYPALYLLDGNAALSALREPWLQQLDAGSPPLLVMIGYATELRFDVASRAYDYTPAAQPGEALLDDQGRAAGGSQAFRQLIEQRIKPLVESRHPLDRTRQGLWGHSFGGLFVLDSLFAAPQGFQHYYAASPSLWWQGGLVLELEKRLPADAVAQLVLMRGGAEGLRHRGQDSAGARARASLPATALPQLAERLDRLPGLDVQYQEIAGLEHGPMLPASLEQALRLFGRQ